jgi:hypothetical protein
MADQTAKVEKIKEIINKMELEDQLNALEEVRNLVAANHEFEHQKTLNRSKELQEKLGKLKPNSEMLVQDAGITLNLDEYKKFSE